MKPVAKRILVTAILISAVFLPSCNLISRARPTPAKEQGKSDTGNSVAPPLKARVFTLDELRKYHKTIPDQYLEFVHVPSMSAGLYSIKVGGTDPQTYHHEDELYYVVRGKATLMIDGHDYPVGPGAAAFVPKTIHHRFHDITEAVDVLVFFSPKEVPLTGENTLYPGAVSSASAKGHPAVSNR